MGKSVSGNQRGDKRQRPATAGVESRSRRAGRVRSRLARGRGRRARVRPAARSRRARSPARRTRPTRWQRSHGGAQHALRKYRQATLLAVALTALLLLVWGPTHSEANVQPESESTASENAAGPDETSAAADANPAEAALEEAGQEGATLEAEAQEEAAQDQEPTDSELSQPDPIKSLEEATGTVRGLFNQVITVLPKLFVALLLLVLAWITSVVLRFLLHRALSGWEKSEAFSAMARIALFLLAIGAGLSVISGDVTALVGSVGLVGLALSWALQSPIESFTGWVLNALRGHYRTGDRIEVGDVFGDVYRIDVLTTTVWEAGGVGKSVAGSQPTGAFVTFPNWEILRSNIINYSRDFPYVWDEVTIGIANESDLRYVIEVIGRAADEVVGEMMRAPALEYARLLKSRRLAFGVEEKPQVYLAPDEAWINCTVRYLVPLRERRRWSTELIVALSAELARSEHHGRIISGYPRTNIELLDAGHTGDADSQA